MPPPEPETDSDSDDPPPSGFPSPAWATVTVDGKRKRQCSWPEPDGAECGTCVQNTNSKFEDHWRTHTGECPYPCRLGNCTKAFAQSGGGSRFVLGARVRSTWKVLLGGTATPEAVGASLSSSRGWFFEEIDQCTLTRPCQNKSHFASTRSLQSRRGSARRSEASCVSIRCPSRSSDATQKSQVATDTRRRARGR